MFSLALVFAGILSSVSSGWSNHPIIFSVLFSGSVAYAGYLISDFARLKDNLITNGWGNTFILLAGMLLAWIVITLIGFLIGKVTSSIF